MSQHAVKIGIGLLAVVSVVLVALLFWPRETPVTEPEPTVTQEPVTPPTETATETTGSDAGVSTTESGETEDAAEALVPGPAPDLEQSDAYLRERWSETNEVMGSVLQSEDLIRKVTTAVELMSMERNPGKMLHFLRPDDGFKTVKNESGQVTLSPENYKRYDRLVTSFESLDTDLVAAYYVKMAPVFETAYGELGNGDQAREQKFEDIYKRIMAIKVPEEPVELIGGPQIYIFADEQLEARTALEKAFIRMGPQNTRRIQTKLQAVYEAYMRQR